MSKLAKRPILIPKGVEVNHAAGSICIKGPKGALTRSLPKDLQAALAGENLMVTMRENSSLAKSMLGLYHALIKGMVEGVTKGFEKRLTLIGVGYRAALQGRELELQLGYSNPIKLTLPEGIQVKIDKNVNIVVEGIDKRLVGQFAADIRAKRAPEPYKGKGVRYEKEYVRKKAGKTGK